MKALSLLISILTLVVFIGCSGPPSRSNASKMIKEKYYSNETSVTMDIILGDLFESGGRTDDFMYENRMYQQCSLKNMYISLSQLGYIEFKSLGTVHYDHPPGGAMGWSTDCHGYKAILTEKGKTLFSFKEERDAYYHKDDTYGPSKSTPHRYVYTVPLCKFQFIEVTGIVSDENNKYARVDYSCGP